MDMFPASTDSQMTTAGSDSSSSTTGNELPSSRELAKLNDELSQLNGEKLKLEEEVNRDEATMRLKQSEIKSMQNETETLYQMVRQLDVQKGEARKRLDDLASQVEKLKKEVAEQKAKVTADEKEVNSKKKELEQVRSEESALKSQLAIIKREIESISNVSGQTQLQISQAKSILASLEEYQMRLKDGTADLEAAISNNDIHKLTTIIARPLTPPPEMKANDASNTGFDADPFKDTSLINDLSGDPFAGEDPFASEEDPFSRPAGGQSAFANDSAWDPFSSSSNQSGFPESSSDAFDPFGTLAIPPKQSTVAKNDPFANSAKSDSNAPELPPKGQIGAGAPPRPALPKSGKAGNGGSKSTDPWGSSDPFGSSATSTQANDSFDPFGAGGNFANFDQM